MTASPVIAMLDAGTYYHHRTLHTPSLAPYLDRALYLPELDDAALADCDALIVSCRSNPDLLMAQRERLARFLASGKTLVAMGETASHRWLEGVSWTPCEVNCWTVSAGGRYDWFRSDVNLSPLPSPDLLPAFKAARNSTQNAVTGSLGLSYRATEVVELLGGVSTSFRMPWTSEMFSSGYTGTSYTIPHPALKPERGRSVELGSRLHFEQATVGMTAFRSDFRDFLESSVTRYEGLPATQRRNVGRARIQGLEMDWRWQLTRSVNFYGNASYLHATNRNTDQPLQAIAPLNGLMGLQYVGPNEAYALSAELQWAKGQSRYDKRTEYPSPGYGTVNVYAQLQLDRLGLPRLGDTQLTLGVTNLFDRSYRTAATASNINYPMTDLNPLLEPGRSLMLTLRTRF